MVEASARHIGEPHVKQKEKLKTFQLIPEIFCMGPADRSRADPGFLRLAMAARSADLTMSRMEIPAAGFASL